MQRNNKIEEDIKEVLNEVLDELGVVGGSIRFEDYNAEYRTWSYETGYFKINTFVDNSIRIRISLYYKFNKLDFEIISDTNTGETTIPICRYSKATFKPFVKKCIENYIDMEIMHNKGYSQRQLDILCNLHKCTVNNVFNKKRDIAFKTRHKISEVLGVNFED